MSLYPTIIEKLDHEVKANSYVYKSSDRYKSACIRLIGFGLDPNSGCFEFFSKYSPSAMLRKVDGKELESIDHQYDGISSNTKWVQDLGLSDNFILLTNFEDEYFLAYSKSNCKIYGINFGEFEKANANELIAKWDSIEAMLADYLEV